MCQSHRNSQLSLAQDNPSSFSHPPQLWLIKLSQNFLYNTYFLHHITSATIWSHYEDRGSIFSQNIRKFNLWLTFKNCVSYIKDGHTTTLQMLHFIFFFSKNISTEYFKHAAHSPTFSSKCHLFHNAAFGSCIIHILHTECAKI
jgi:hypothetical protein